MKTAILKASLCGALLASCLSVHALTLGLTGYAAGSQTVSLSGAASASNVGAGAFVGTLSGAPGFNANPFYTYCVELGQSFSFGSPLAGYSIVNGLSYFGAPPAGVTASGATVVSRLGKLFTYLGGVNLPASALNSAAIQVAVWESIYEGTSQPLSASASAGANLGFVSSNASVTAAANALLTAAAAVTTSVYSISVLTNANAQDFLLIQQIPTPGTLALVALALAGVAGISRRRV